MQLGQRMQDGATLRDHLQAAARQGIVDDRLDKQPPMLTAPLWSVFAALNAARPSSMGGVNAIPPSEVLAWQQLHGVRLTSWEIDTLIAMDHAVMGVAAKAKQ